MKDFFEHQAAARRRTALLVFYFGIAVVLIVVAFNLVTAATLARLEAIDARQERTSVDRYRSGYFPRQSEPEGLPGLLSWSPELVAWTTGIILALIGGGALHRWLSLREGGRAVVHLIGGRELSPGTSDLEERRLLNIVEELSIASGVPQPAVFVLDGERGINAFVAGFTPSDAAIAITRRALDTLSRDELQGVVAHEFSHLLNGDMRLNLRLVSVLFGILMLAMIGHSLLHMFDGYARSSARKGRGFFVGLPLLIIGYEGYFLGCLIQAAVSRQREFLADAAAVQFTRNPAGIAGALKRIGAAPAGSRIKAESAMQFRHIFFAQAFSGGFAFFATHPSLARRIRAIEPHWDGRFPAIPLASPMDDGVQPRGTTPPPSLAIQAADFLAFVGAPTAAHLDRARDLLATIPPRLATAARSPAEALSVVFTLLLADDPAIRHQQLELVRIRHHAPSSAAVDAFGPMTDDLAPTTDTLARELRFPLLNLALPALRALPSADIDSALETVRLLIAADGEVTLFEFMVEKALDRHVAGPARGRRPGVVNYYSFGGLSAEIGVLLSALARAGSDSAAETARAFAAAAARIPALTGQLQLLPADACGLDAISTALDKLVQASPAIRKVLLLAGAEAGAADGTVEPDEAELLRAVADALDCPIPPLLG